jgi:hypothetical protein
VKEVENNNKEDQIYDKQYLEKKVDFKGRKGEPRYDPPLPVSVVKEDKHTLYGDIKELDGIPTSVLEMKSTRGKHSTEKPVALMECVKI